MSNRIDQQFGNFRLIRLIGKGGFAEVYLAEHVLLGTQMAVKVLHAQLVKQDHLEFVQEARLISSLEHPSIVRVLDCGIEDDTPYLVMNYAPNGTLRERYPKGSRLPLTDIVSYTQQVAAALSYAHERKLIHRDIKPENMLIGEQQEILLSDFGIALISSTSSVQSTKAAAGTIAYMAPEQIMGKPRFASDQYSLGVVVYEWLCGQRPFRGNFSELCAQHLYAPPTPLSERLPTIPLELDALVLKALAKEPQQRFPTVQAFADALKEYCQKPENAALLEALAEENIVTYISPYDPEENEPTAPRVEVRGAPVLAAVAGGAGEAGDKRYVTAPLPELEEELEAPLSETREAVKVEGVDSTRDAVVVSPAPILEKLETPAAALALLEPTVKISEPVAPATVKFLTSYPLQRPDRKRLFALLTFVLILAIIGTSLALVPKMIHATPAPGKAGKVAQVPKVTGTDLSVSPSGVTSTPTHTRTPTARPTAKPKATATVPPLLVVTPGAAPTTAPPPVIVPTAAPKPVPTRAPAPTQPPPPTATPIPPPPTATPIPTQPPPLPAKLQASPGSYVDSSNGSCAADSMSHGGVVYLGSCTFTLSNTGGSSQALNWTGALSNSAYALSPTSGSIAPGQSQSINLSINSGCPVTVTITLSGPANTVQVPVICTQIFVTPGGQDFSSSNCTHAGNWTCVVTVAAASQNGATTHWTVRPSSANGTTFSPGGGALGPGGSVQVTITVPAASCPGSNQFDFSVLGGEIDGFDNYLNFSC